MDGEISGPELEDALEDDEEPLIVDIRNPQQFERERIEGSINIPLGQLPQQVDRVSDADHVVTVCPHGQASVRAARLITSFEGFDGTVESLECGLTGWEGPTETADRRATTESTDETQSPDAPF
ncbi:MAG: rhodanese-like domain-containing protein [Halovenus sp.]